MHIHFYRRKLPHYQPVQGTFFVTFRLANSIPMDKLHRMYAHFNLIKSHILTLNELPYAQQKEQLFIAQKRLFVAQDEYLDLSLNGPYWLLQKEVSEVVAQEMKLHDAHWFNLWAYCIMSNHVHLLLTLLPNAPGLTKIMQNIKGYSAIKANRILGRNGQFWERESYDHVVRNGHSFERIVKYILENPVKAKVVKSWRKHEFTYLHPDLTHLAPE
ncbi:MAG: transposase [Saprospiraceae bacterium]|nr:transposase [Saprospiraceae bacterium]